MDYQTWRLARIKCEQCTHCLTETDPKQDKPDTILRCSIAPSKRRGSQFQYCNYARDPGEPCGPDALLFKEKA